MPAKNKSIKRSAETGAFVLGAARFEKISAVEGIKLKPAIKKRVPIANTAKSTPEEYRKSILRAYKKA